MLLEPVARKLLAIDDTQLTDEARMVKVIILTTMGCIVPPVRSEQLFGLSQVAALISNTELGDIAES